MAARVENFTCCHSKPILKVCLPRILVTSSVSWNVELTSSEGKKALLPRVASPLIPNAGSPPFSCNCGITLDAKLYGKIGQIVGGWRNTRGVEIVQARTEDVDQGRGERMGITERALLGVGGLVALLETPTVGDSAENARNELRVVHQAEAEEQLVLVVEIEVHAGVKSVAVLKKLRRIGEVREKRTDRVGGGVPGKDSTARSR